MYAGSSPDQVLFQFFSCVAWWSQQRVWGCKCVGGRFSVIQDVTLLPKEVWRHAKLTVKDDICTECVESAYSLFTTQRFKGHPVCWLAHQTPYVGSCVYALFLTFDCLHPDNMLQKVQCWVHLVDKQFGPLSRWLSFDPNHYKCGKGAYKIECQSDT